MLLKSPYTQAEEACEEISRQAAGWKRAIRDDIVALNKTRILCEIDDLHMLRYGVFLKELLTLAVSEAEEYHINLIKGHLVGELQIGFTDEAFMYIADEIAGITLRVCKDNLCLRMVQQQTNQFSACIACCT